MSQLEGPAQDWHLSLLGQGASNACLEHSVNQGCGLFARFERHLCILKNRSVLFWNSHPQSGRDRGKPEPLRLYLTRKTSLSFLTRKHDHCSEAEDILLSLPAWHLVTSS